MWGESREQYDQVYNGDGLQENKPELSHELLAGGASFMAMKMFEDRQRKEGKPVSHQFAKELLASFAGAEVDRLAETKGADFIDRERAKRDAEKRTRELYDDHYGSADNYDPSQSQPNQYIQDSRDY
ncbi:hypothetical protein AMS68_006999 [Peltaster fructicola]|uniref:CipC-like antibiotic response protein n=1 Tax=Peltaster fructicola TaxID=286661 RepID=A0A6H0Y386_9PEZI|nr:hypothetical protein AMS68_006999 [Peltaster fructicola]